MNDEHPEAALRGRMIREVWDSTPWMTYEDAVSAVDALLAMPELNSVTYSPRTPTTDLLSEFLLARIAEDEAVARSAGDDPTWPLSCARLLAECEAKRRMVKLAKTASEREMISVPVTALTLRVLALVYADHPDYRDEWRPR